MVNPGAFPGSRRTFLLSQKEYYAEGVRDGFAPEALATIQRRYFNRYPIELPHDEEPSAEHLEAVDNDAAIPETPEPNPDGMSVEEYAKALSEMEARQKLILYRKAQIRRWLQYQYMKDLDPESSASGVFNPFRALFFQLTGRKLNAPRKRSAANTWRKTERESIEIEVKSRRDRQVANLPEGVKADSLITLRDRVAREWFEKLTKEEQQHWRVVANQDHQVAMKKWKEELEAKPATDPKSRQIAIQAIVKLMEPILDGVCEATGWKASFIAGGPEPAQGGLLNIISIHSGKTSGDIKLSFGAAERERFRKTVVPLYGGFLQKCFTPAECRSRALNAEEGFMPLSKLDLEYEGASTDTISATSSLATAISGGNEISRPATVSAIPESSAAIATQDFIADSLPADVTIASEPGIIEGAVTAIQEELEKGMDVEDEIDLDDLEAELEDVVAALGNPFPFDAPAESPLPSPCPSPMPEEFAASETTTGSHVVSSTSPCLAGNSMEVDKDLELAELTGAPDNRDAMAGNQPPSTRPRRSQRVNQDVNVEKVSKRGKKRGLAQSAVQSPDANPNTIVDANASTNTATNVDAKANKAGSTALGTLPPPAKRARLEAAQSVVRQPPSTFEVPPSAPEWFKKAFSMLLSKDLGAEWAVLVTAWGEFESRSGFSGSMKVAAKHRPEAVKDWIQRARSPTWRPQIQSVTAYGAQFTTWWQGIQPDWRILRGGKLLRVAGKDWEMLNRPGLNGLLSVAAGLFFWGCEVQSVSEKAAWMEAVVDLDFVLSQLLANI